MIAMFDVMEQNATPIAGEDGEDGKAAFRRQMKRTREALLQAVPSAAASKFGPNASALLAFMRGQTAGNLNSAINNALSVQAQLLAQCASAQSSPVAQQRRGISPSPVCLPSRHVVPPLRPSAVTQVRCVDAKDESSGRASGRPSR